MPGKTVKNWPMYEALRENGKSKESAARITNAAVKKRKKKRGKK
jgi:hypothetical protein